jgi:gluconokinase
MATQADSLVLAFDVGTSSLRTALFDASGRRLEEFTAQLAYPLHASADGAAELDPAVLARAAEECLGITLAALRRSRAHRGTPILAAGTSCFWHSLLLLDGKFRPVSPVYTWGDARCRDDAARLRRELKEAEVHRRTGCMLRASFWPAKLRWLARTEKARLKKARWLVSPAEWLTFHFCGSLRNSLSMASGTGLFQPRTNTWDAALLKKCGIRKAQLAEVSDAPLVFSAAMAKRFPELEGTLWFPGIGDGAASNLGSDAVRPGVAAINMGTSGAVRVVLPSLSRPVPFGLFSYRIDAKRFLVGGAISNAGNVRAWCLRELRLPDAPEVLEKALERRPGPVPGLAVLPYLLSERAPSWCEEVPAVIAGIHPGTTALDLLQALTEGTYVRMARIADHLKAASGRKLRFVVSGGIQKSRDALQRLADVMDAELVPSAEPEASIRGAAVFALEQMGAAPAALKHGKPVKPRGAAAKRYAALRRDQERMEKAAVARDARG